MPYTSQYLEQKIYNNIFLEDTFLKPTLTIGLTKDVPSAGGVFQEVAGGGYVRYPNAGAGEYWSDWAAMGPEGSGYNIVSFNFGPATADWGMISGVIIFDENYNVLFHGALNRPAFVYEGDGFTFAPASLVVSFL
jgi:hypothetical protein